jgi:hypothetical protein
MLRRKALLITAIIIGIEFFISTNLSSVFNILVNNYRWWLEGHNIPLDAASLVFNLTYHLIFGITLFFLLRWMLRSGVEKAKRTEPLRAEDVLKLLSDEELANLREQATQETSETLTLQERLRAK